MADLVIRGMEMPQRCKACRFCGFGGRRSELNVCMFTGESQPKLSQERMSKCPLVPLPEGHGRLIDADKLAEDLQLDVEYEQRALDDLNIVCVNRERLQFDKDCKQNCMWYLSECPTIIPAEGETEK